MSELDNVLRIVGKLGISDPNNPSPQDMKVILDAYLKKTKLDSDMLTTYIRSLSAPLKAMFEAFKKFSSDDMEVSKSVLEIINKAVTIIDNQLNSKDLSREDQQKLLEIMMQYVKMAREEADKARTEKTRWALLGTGVVLVIAGAAYEMASKGKGSEMLGKGIESLMKVIEKG